MQVSGHAMTTDIANINRQKNEQKYIQNKKSNLTFSTFGFARHTSQRFAKPKELNFATAQHRYD